jgi:myo-inositol 2-dehydrogenase/D-chiro-inositol 1-dehydrogenase
VQFAGEKGISADPVQNFFLERYAAAYRNEIEAFIDALVSGKKPKPDGTDGLKAQMMADAATKSRETGKPVKIG